MNDVLHLMAAHRSVRRFTPQALPEDDIAEAVRAAQMASTSSWIQAYHLLQVTDPRRRERLAELSGGQAQVREAGAFFVVSADTYRHRRLAEEHGETYAANLEVFLTATIDASLFAQNLALAFESQGYGICMIGGLRRELAEVDALLGLPQGVWPLFGLCVGRPAEETAQRPRLPLDLVWSRDAYPSEEVLRSSLAEFERVSGAHYEARGLPGRTWGGGVVRKFREPTRRGLSAFYASKGASLD